MFKTRWIDAHMFNDTLLHRLPRITRKQRNTIEEISLRKTRDLKACIVRLFSFQVVDS